MRVAASVAIVALIVIAGRLAMAAPSRAYLPAVRQPASPTLATTATAEPSATPTEDPTICAPEYPGLCLSPPPPDLDCADLAWSHFPALAPDRHHLDADGDGIGCADGE